MYLFSIRIFFESGRFRWFAQKIIHKVLMWLVQKDTAVPIKFSLSHEYVNTFLIIIRNMPSFGILFLYYCYYYFLPRWEIFSILRDCGEVEVAALHELYDRRSRLLFCLSALKMSMFEGEVCVHMLQRLVISSTKSATSSDGCFPIENRIDGVTF